MKRIWVLPCLLVCAFSTVSGAEQPDVLLADFEGKDWGEWKVTGDAFGPGPARGTLPNQMPVSGFLGKGLVNSYHGGDASTGTLTSPNFKIERKYINFLIGGGKYPGKTCMNLLVDGKVARTATGPNDRPGGSEALDWQSWDVSDLAGKMAVIEIVDQHTGGWGHICVDHIVQSDRKRQSQPQSRELAIASRYLHLPVKTGAPKRQMRILLGERIVREFEIELAPDRPDFWAFCDVSAFKGQKLRIETTLPADSKAMESISQSDALKDADTLYREKHRPQFHFTSRRGWLNDPNGLVHFQGEWHLFYQHNPYGWDWGNMHWGHAVSKDLVHWEELPIALYPRPHPTLPPRGEGRVGGDWAFSGSAVVDTSNTSGWGKDSEPPLVAAWTSTGRGECIAFSTDRGRTWQEYEGNPVVKHAGRDPRLLWHAPTKQWVMAVYDEHEGKRWIAFHTSPDLKKWTFQSRIVDFFECPDLFELPVDGKKQTKWVLYAADGKYILGDFDGKRFKKESGKHQLWHGNFYAAQTFSNAPDGRRIQIGWGQGITFPGMPFNQQMTIPCELTLRTTPDGVRMFAEPVIELEKLHGARKQSWHERTIKAGAQEFDSECPELCEIRAVFVPGSAEVFGLTVRGQTIEYNAKKQMLTCKGRNVPLKLREGELALRIFGDRGSIEVFGNHGEAALSVGVLIPEKERSLSVFSRGGETTLRSLKAIELKSAWSKP
jgi:fructan beta-fructosidase